MRERIVSLQERVHSAPPPPHWGLHKLHRVFRVRKGYKNTGMREANLLSLSYGRIVHKRIDADEGLLPENFERYQIVEPDNIIMRLTDLQNDKRSLRQGIVKERGIITSAYDALEVGRGHNPRFWAYALLALDLAKYYYSLGGGVRQSIKFSDFPNEWIATPSAEIQKTIADFLDRETARIDQLIEKQQRLVMLLQESRRAHIAHKFAKLNVRTWRIRHVGKLKNGAGFPVHLQGDPSQDLPFFKVKHLKTHGLDTSISDTGDTISRKTAASLRATVFPKGTIVFAKIGAALLLGRFSVLGLPACIDNNMAAFIPDKRLLESSFALLGLSLADVTRMVRPGAVPSLNTEAFYNYKIPLPPKETQTRIVDEIRMWSSRGVQSVRKAEDSTDRLQELRSALITAAVTGQINVVNRSRKWQTEH